MGFMKTLLTMSVLFSVSTSFGQAMTTFSSGDSSQVGVGTSFVTETKENPLQVDSSLPTYEVEVKNEFQKLLNRFAEDMSKSEGGTMMATLPYAVENHTPELFGFPLSDDSFALYKKLNLKIENLNFQKASFVRTNRSYAYCAYNPAENTVFIDDQFKSLPQERSQQIKAIFIQLISECQK